ncbi:MAG TPA: ABC transporter substrate-binding protein/permease [Pirellulaceae bacterium]
MLTRFHGEWLIMAWLCLGGVRADPIASADTLAEIRERGVLVWGGDAEGGGPFVFPDDEDPSKVRGFEVEIVDWIAAELGVRAEFSQCPWDKLPDLLNRGDIDIVFNGYEWSRSWAARFATTVPYYVYELQLLARQSDNSLTAFEDLGRRIEGRRRRVGVMGGSAAEAYVVARFGSDIDVVRFDGITDNLRAVELAIDGLDATVQDLPVVTFYGRRFPRLKSVGQPVAPGYYVAILRRDDTALRDALNRAILKGLQDGSFQKILERYGLWNDAQKRRGLLLDGQGNFAPESAGSVETPRDDRSITGWPAVWQRLPALLQGAMITVALSLLAMPLASVLGIGMALLRVYGPGSLRWLPATYVELIRGTPLVLQLYLIFFLLPEIGLSLPAFWAGVLGLGLNYSAYEAEIYRAGLLAIPRGQMEAALALGMSRSLAVRRVILPQALRLVIFPVTNDFIALFKDTAVCSVITIVELSKSYYIHARSTGAIVELGMVTALLYLLMSYPLAYLTNRMDAHLRPESKN